MKNKQKRGAIYVSATNKPAINPASPDVFVMADVFVMTIVELAGSGALSLLAGLMIGCIGIGGVILVPALTYIVGAPIQSSIDGAMMAYIVSGVVGAAVYARQGSIRWPMALWLGAGAMPGALIGALVGHLTQPLILEASIGVLTLTSGVYTLCARHLGSLQKPPVSNPALAGIGVATGFWSAITGTGGPFILMPLLIWLDLPMLTSIGLSQAIQLPIAVLATVGNIISGSPDYVLAGLLALGLTLGSWVGARLAHGLPQLILKRLVAGLLVTVGTLIMLKMVQKLSF